MLERTLRLFIAVQDLASTNKALRAEWERRQTTDLLFVRDLVAAKPGTSSNATGMVLLNLHSSEDADRASTPLSVCRELALQIVQDLPNTLIDETTLPKASSMTLEYYR